MWRAIQKYGFENFKHEILEDGLTEEEAKAHEIALITEYRTTEHDYGYNGTEGGDGVKGCAWTDERKKAFRQKRLGHPVSEETRSKLREARKGYVVPPHVLEAVHAATKGRKQSTEEIERRRKSLIGRKLSPEHKARLIEFMSGPNNPSRGKKQSPETIAKRVASRAGYKHSDETKAKIGEAVRGNSNPKGKSGRTYNQKNVIQMDSNKNLIAEYESTAEAALKTGLRQSTISRYCRRERVPANGHIWQYA